MYALILLKFRLPLLFGLLCLFLGAAHADTWADLRDGYKLERHFDHPAVVAERRIMQRQRREWTGRLQNGVTHLPFIIAQLQRRKLPLELALIPAVESRFDVTAESHRGAAGLWQLMPGTAEYLGLRSDWWFDARRDIPSSTRTAITYLADLAERFDGDWLAAIASYNGGAGTIRKAFRQGATDVFSPLLREETRRYTPRVLALASIIAQPDQYGFKLPEAQPEMGAREVRVRRPVDLAIAARWAGLPLATLRAHNAGYRRWVTPPTGTRNLYLPAAAAARFEAHVQTQPEAAFVDWHSYRVKSGDTWSALAQRQGVSQDWLQRKNHGQRQLRAGAILMLPHPASNPVAYAMTQPVIATPLQPVQKQHRKTYRVRDGDSLWAIARRHDVTVKDLARWNGIGRGSVLRPGQTLQIASAPAKAKAPVTYKVKQGDTLWNIARTHGVRVAELKRWNGLSNRGVLRPGQRLQLHLSGS